MNQEKSLKKISWLMSVFVADIEHNNAMGLLDKNKIAEDILRSIFSEVYEYSNLINLNDEKDNYPGIDLGDKIKKVAFQLSSTIDNKKIKETLQKFINKTYYIEYSRLIIYDITKKQDSYAGAGWAEIINGKFTFSDKDIWDSKDLLKSIVHLNVEKIFKIEKLLEKHFGNLSEQASLLTPLIDRILNKCQSDINTQKLKALYKKIVPVGQDLEVYTISSVIKSLASLLTQQDGSIALVTFLKHLPQIFSNIKDKDSEEWIAFITSTISEVDLKPATLDLSNIDWLRKNYLVVTLEPKLGIEDLEEELFAIQAWYYEGENITAITTSPDQEIKGLVGVLQQLHKFMGKLDQSENVIIEIFLPYTYFCYPLELKLVKLGMTCHERIGVKYPIVLRSIERISPEYREDMLPNWKIKTNKLKNYLNNRTLFSLDQLVCKVLEHGDIDNLKSHNICCVGIYYDLTDHTDSKINEAFMAMIDSGTPVGVWFRKGCDTSILDILLDNVSSIPENVLLQRQEFARDNNAKELVVLWDSYERLPPDIEAWAKDYSI